MPTRAACIVLFLAVLLNAAYVTQRWGPNQLSRFSLLFSMVHEQSVRIDALADINLDSATAGGHTYSDKAPGTAFLGLPGFGIGYVMQRLAGVDAMSYAGLLISSWTATLGASGFYAALGAVAMLILLCRLLGTGAGFAGAAGLALGTLQLPYATQLFSHASTMGLVSIAMLLLLAPRSKTKKTDTVVAALRGGGMALTLMAGGTAAAVLPLGGGAFTAGVLTAMIGVGMALTAAVSHMHGGGLTPTERDLLAGLALGMAVIGEYPAFIGAAMLVLPALKSRRRIAALAAGATCPLLLFFAYNILAFGSPLSIGYQHNDYAWMQQGFLGFVPSVNADLLYALLFSQGRGLFFWSPFLLLCLPGYRRLFRESRPLFWTCLAGPALTVLALSAMGSAYGGSAVGPRYLAPAVPLLVLAATAGLRDLPRFGRALIAASAAMNLLAALVNPQMPEFMASPFFTFYLANAVRGSLMVNMGLALGLPGGWSALPIVLLDAAVLWWLLRAQAPVTRTSARRRARRAAA